MATIDSVRAVMAAEGLDDLAHVIDGDPANRTDCLVVTRRDDAWVSFSTDERAAVVDGSVRTYPSESEALEDFLVLLRLKKLLRDLQRERDLERVEGAAMSLASLPAQMEAEDVNRVRVALGDDYLRRPDCLAVARRDGVWSTFYVDERAAVEERSLHTFPDEVSAVADFLDRLRSQHRKLEIQDELRDRRRRAGEPS
ncbi:hypothetical protein IFT36_11000 [Frigoribacterium sp. CFBP 13605]|uniref:hypothetical protein n=1 Tax=Frigoribacterium sp. CFBP 13605 TaxID=2774034 RepID=UPI001902CCA3|nr:hypothetical protein [Frigoribacterium sp. CFBP 13605]MBD8141068.1 hypothetical protein [Frigoribacterium sp. CFBP 13605]